jgi:hypothetical protein
MNCPSRTDDEILFNPGWNQSPPRFAADLTTCEDLNGIANARELGEADRLRSGSRSLRRCELEETNGQEIEKRRVIAMGEGVKGFPTSTLQLHVGLGNCEADTLAGPCTRTTAHISEHRAGLTATVISWAKWLLSVLCTSILICYASGSLSRPKFFMPAGKTIH